MVCYKIKTLAVTGALCVALSACLGSKTEEIKHADLEGSEFLKILAREYRNLSQKEEASYDWFDADHFADKGLAAARGVGVMPENPDNWDIDREYMQQLRKARVELLGNISDKVKRDMPDAAARAYALYDCWVEEQEENWQDSDIAQCRDGFFRTLNYISVAENRGAVHSDIVYDGQENSAHEMEFVINKDLYATNYVVFFPLGSGKINIQGEEALRQVALELEGISDYSITLNGHTDRLGGEYGNLTLSRERAQAVKDYLVKLGINPQNVKLFGFGESDPARVTSDNVSDPANRRVEIFVE